MSTINNYSLIPVNDDRFSLSTTLGQLSFDYITLLNADVNNEKDRALILVKVSNKETLASAGFESVTAWAEALNIGLNKATVSKSNKAVGRFHDSEEHIRDYWERYSLSQLEEMSGYSDDFITTCDINPTMSAKAIRDALKRKGGMLDVKSSVKGEKAETEPTKAETEPTNAENETAKAETEIAKAETKMPYSADFKTLGDALECVRVRTLAKGETVNIARSKDGKTFTVVVITA